MKVKAKSKSRSRARNGVSSEIRGRRGLGLSHGINYETARAISKLRTTLLQDEQGINPRSQRAGRSRKRHSRMGGGNGISTRTSFYPTLLVGKISSLDNMDTEVEGGDLPAMIEEDQGQTTRTRTTRSSVLSRVSDLVPQVTEMEMDTPNQGDVMRELVGHNGKNTVPPTESNECTEYNSKLPVASTITPATPARHNKLDIGSLNRILVHKRESKAVFPADVIQEFKDVGLPATTPIKYAMGFPSHPSNRNSRRVGFSPQTKGNENSNMKIRNFTPPSKVRPPPEETVESAKVSTIPRYMRATVSSAGKSATPVSTSRIHNRMSERLPPPSVPMRRKSEFHPRVMTTKTPITTSPALKRKSIQFTSASTKSSTMTPKPVIERKAWNYSTNTLDLSSNLHLQSNTHGTSRKLFVKSSTFNTKAKPVGSGKKEKGLVPMKAMSLKGSRNRTTSSGSDILNVTFTVDDPKDDKQQS